ncbi:membrane protein [Streptomyces sp. SBT349]|uniref:membrane protein n=1 Tax=Streptomyces sp. SBT349 TaxID=1580539 RepID=UPI00066C0215|nr:membrane protein [Streptomyces sp. SBT349]
MASVDSAEHVGTTPALRRLYVIRFLFAAAWAVVLLVSGSDLTVEAKLLLFLYPAFDVVAAIVDVRSARPDGPVTSLYVNIAVSSLATVGVAVAGTSGVADVLRVWGAWAVVSGLVQLLVGVARRPMGGQWAMIVSGGISVLAGATFIRSASRDDPSLTTLAGYAALGGIFFLVSALRLSRSTRRG